MLTAIVARQCLNALRPGNSGHKRSPRRLAEPAIATPNAEHPAHQSAAIGFASSSCRHLRTDW
jgi:hypothetical protein